ncbi:MAG: hypothetical protein HY537_13175 [Deltaproteobacteria bacterium]|nr:hypothetical protein [Deltaproteobacteria bacterium]
MKYWNKPVDVEFSRFRVLPGKSQKVDEWLDYLRSHLSEVSATLDGEKMYVETIFREKTESGEEYLCWYSIQGQGGTLVQNSSHEIDRIHLQYWRECIDPSYKRVDLVTEVIMLDPRIFSVIAKESNH